MEYVILAIIYLITLPIILIYTFWRLSQEIGYLNYTRGMDRTKAEEKYKEMISIIKRVNKYGKIFFVIIIIILPVWSFSSSVVLDGNMHKERIYVPGASYPPLLDPISHKIGPTYNVDNVLEEMTENPTIWLPEEVNRHVDLDDLTKIPGRLAIYRFRGDRYLITYTYLAPFPIIDTYGFTIRDVDEFYIFSLNKTDYEEYLEEGEIHEEVMEAFQNEDLEVDDESELSKEENKWSVTVNGQKEYSIKIEDGDLNIYGGGYVRLLPPEHNTLIYPNFALNPNDLI